MNTLIKRTFASLSNIIQSSNVLKIAGFSDGSFLISNNRVIDTSVVMHPEKNYSWKVQNLKDINTDSLVFATLLRPLPGYISWLITETVIIGTGKSNLPIDDSVKQYLKRFGISLQVHDTVSIDLFNFKEKCIVSI